MGIEVTIFFLALLATPVTGFLVGTIVGRKRLVRLSFWVLIAFYGLHAAVYATCSAMPHSWPIRPVLEIVLFTQAIFSPAIGLGFIVKGVLDRRRRVRLVLNACPTCHYDVHASSTGICPECGTRLWVAKQPD